MTQQNLAFNDNRHLARANDPITSLDAAASFNPTKMQGKVLEAIRHLGPCIYDDVLIYCEGKHGIRSSSSVSSRFNELEKKGLIVNTGTTKPGRSGKQQRVWVSV